MPYYLVQANFTAKSWDAFIAKPEDREATIRRVAEASGCKLHNLFFAFGETDSVALIEAPDQKTMMSVLVAVAASGAVSVRTTVLVTAAEAKEAMQQAGRIRGFYRLPGAS